jgi:hypothetical protein
VGSETLYSWQISTIPPCYDASMRHSPLTGNVLHYSDSMHSTGGWYSRFNIWLPASWELKCPCFQMTDTPELQYSCQLIPLRIWNPYFHMTWHNVHSFCLHIVQKNEKYSNLLWYGYTLDHNTLKIVTVHSS